MKAVLLKNWNLVRVLRMAIGVWLVVAAFQTKEIVLGLMGGLLLALAVMNIGCCGVRDCAVQSPDKNLSQKPEEVNYEEIIQK